MELIIKLYNEKPSRVGIKFIYEFQAVKAYEQILSKHGENFFLSMEVQRGQVKLVLQSEKDGAKLEFRELGFKPDQVNRLRQFCSGNYSLQFVHVFPKENKLFVARPFKQERFINVINMKFIGMED